MKKKITNPERSRLDQAGSGMIVSVNISVRKGTVKTPVPEIELVSGLGVRGDAHASPGDRQISLLMKESIDRAREAQKPGTAKKVTKKPVELSAGSFAENLTTQGIDLLSLKPGDTLTLSKGPRLRVTRIGKECPRPCAIYYQLGDCLMPSQGIFCEVLAGGRVRPGDKIGQD